MINYLIKKFIPKNIKGVALDIGCGEGTNTKYLAQRGLDVVAIDTNKNLIREAEKIMKKEGRGKIVFLKKDVRKFKFRKNYYSVILALYILMFMKKSEMIEIIKKTKMALKPGGLLIIGYFNVMDPLYKKLKRECIHPEVEKNTFFSHSLKQYWNFLEKNELKKIFEEKGFQILFYRERKIKDLKPKLHYHGISEIVIKKLPNEYKE